MYFLFSKFPIVFQGCTWTIEASTDWTLYGIQYLAKMLMELFLDTTCVIEFTIQVTALPIIVWTQVLEYLLSLGWRRRQYMKSKLQVVRLSGKAQGVIFMLRQVCSEKISPLNVMLHMWKDTNFYYGITLVGFHSLLWPGIFSNRHQWYFMIRLDSDKNVNYMKITSTIIGVYAVSIEFTNNK